MLTAAAREDFADFGDAVLDAAVERSGEGAVVDVGLDAVGVGLGGQDGGFGLLDGGLRLLDGGLVGDDRGFDTLDIGFGGVDVGARGLVQSLVVFKGLAGRDVLLHELLGTLVTALRIVHGADGGGEGGLRCGERGFLDLDLRLGLRELGFLHLDLGVGLFEFGHERIGLHLDKRLTGLHVVAFVDQDLFDLAGELGGDVDLGRLKTAVAGGERGVPVDGLFLVGFDEVPGHGDGRDDEERDDDLFHVVHG